MDITKEILSLSEILIRMPTVTVGPTIRLDQVKLAADFIVAYLKEAGLDIRLFDQGDFPAILASFPGNANAPVMLSGHYDVVAPEPDDTQFDPRIEGDYLWGRGAADMKTVVATYMVWMKRVLLAGGPFPDVNLLLVGNEETGELEPMGSGHVMNRFLEEGYAPELFIAGERTEETGSAPWGQVCTQNRGVVRFRVTVYGVRTHSGMSPLAADLTHKIIRARTYLSAMADRYLTLGGKNGWHSQIRFPFVQVGMPGVYNITPDYGTLGVEIRSIPNDRLAELMEEFEQYAFAEALEITEKIFEPGSSCSPENPYLKLLLNAVRTESKQEPVIGRKMAGTSARFAPNGDGVVWGQSGIGPHSAEERHYIPSIEPYYRALDAFGRQTVKPG